MPVAMTTTNSGRGSGSTGRPISPAHCLPCAKSSGTPKSWVLVSTSDACPMFRICPRFGPNANVRRIPMSKNQVRFVCDLWHDLMLLVRKPKQPSLLAEGISWCSNVPWVPRLDAYQQTEDWISIKHTNHEN
jgi:hypothetical protein